MAIERVELTSVDSFCRCIVRLRPPVTWCVGVGLGSARAEWACLAPLEGAKGCRWQGRAPARAGQPRTHPRKTHSSAPWSTRAKQCPSGAGRAPAHNRCPGGARSWGHPFIGRGRWAGGARCRSRACCATRWPSGGLSPGHRALPQLRRASRPRRRSSGSTWACARPGASPPALIRSLAALIPRRGPPRTASSPCRQPSPAMPRR